MPGGYGFSLDYVLQMLTSTLVPREGSESPENNEKPQIVFLLGAGCSRQYGLPNFKELLTYIWDDCFEIPAESLGGFQALRDELDRYWQAQGPEARRDILQRHLSRTPSLSPGYYRLAELAKKGYVKAIVNMNFDDLLERELERVLSESAVRFKVSTSFRVGIEPGNNNLMVYKPHGTIGTFDMLDQLDKAVKIASNIMDSVKDYGQPDAISVNELSRRVTELNGNTWWMPEDILLSAKELDEDAKALNQETKTTLLSRMEQAIRRINEARRNPLWVTNDLILDIANSDLFANPEEQMVAQDLLTSHDVVSIGYSGVDAKIAAALRSFKQGKNSKDKKLYFVNLDPPDPRILLVLAERASQNLCISGEEAAFENFMEQFERMLERRRNPQPAREKEEPARTPYTAPGFLHLMTRDEGIALGECLRLALSIRAAINVGDRSSVSIEEHGNEVYRYCTRLADISGICLTSPEKYLLHCTAFLHDLGYFSAYSGGNAVTGLQLLKTHGKITADLLRQRSGDDPKLADRIVPASYKGVGRDIFIKMLVSLCHYHPAYELPSEAAEFSNVEVEVAGVKVPIRLHMLHALFAVAEHLVREHPFRPSSDPVIDREGSAPPIEDPVLDLYLLRRDSEITFDLKRKKIEGRVAMRHQGQPGSKQALWLLSMANTFVERFSVEHANWPVKFVCKEELAPKQEANGDDWYIFKDLLKEALVEELQRSLDHVRRKGRIDVAKVLDEAEAVLDRILPGKCSPGLVHEAPPELASDLNLILSRIRVWVIAVRTEVRENWIEDMKENLRLADLLIESHLERQGRERPESLKLAGESVHKAFDYFKKNAERASVHAEISTLEAARKVVEIVAERLASSNGLLTELKDLIRLLSQFGIWVQECSVAEAISTLDVLSIYTLPVTDPVTPDPSDSAPREPRVSLHCAPVETGLERLRQAPCMPHQGLLHLYFPLKRTWPGTGAPGASEMERAFLRCYEEIVHPAWRFFARNWHDHSEPLLMARACLDLGSSPFRPEVAGGIKYILGDKIEWGKGAKAGLAYGHDECTICTSRLLYVLSYARRLFSGEDLDRLAQNAQQKGLDETVAGLLRYLRQRDPNAKSWWGLGTETDEDRGVYSADYLAWAARAVTFCRSVDREIQMRTGRSWLQEICGLAPAAMEELVQQRWEQLFSVTTADLLSEHTEEPVTFTLGRVGLAVLDLRRMDGSVWDLVVKPFGKRKTSFADDLKAAKEQVWHDSLAQMSRLYMLPVFLVLDGIRDDKEESAAEIVRICRKGMESRIWIRKGSDAGSWGFNVKNTQAIVTALVAFWRYAFDDQTRFSKAFEEAVGGGGVAKSNGSQPAKGRRREKPPTPAPPAAPPPSRRRSRLPADGPW